MKRGLGDSYDDTYIDEKLRAYVDLTKPASSIGVILAMPFAAIFYGEVHHTDGVAFLADNWRLVFRSAMALFFIHGASQAMNMAEDAEQDKLSEHKQNRPIPSGVVSEEEARSLSWILMFVGIMRAYTIAPKFGVFCTVLSGFGIFYNIEPIRAKNRLWINLVWQSVSRGLLLYPATFAAFGNPWSHVGWGMGVVAFLLVLSMQNTADFSDVNMDAKAGVTTPAVHHGLDSLVIIMAGISGAMFAVIWFMNNAGIFPGLESLYLLVIPIGWSLWSLWNQPMSISEIGDNHSSWYVFYFCLACMFILPAIEVAFI